MMWDGIKYFTKKTAFIAAIILCLSVCDFIITKPVYPGTVKMNLKERIECQKIIEKLYWQYQIWPKENFNAKPQLEDILPPNALKYHVEDIIKKSNALDIYWDQQIKGEDLQQEINRMADHTALPARLKEIWESLDNDATVIAESFYIEGLLDYNPKVIKIAIMKWPKTAFEQWWQTKREYYASDLHQLQYNYKLPLIKSVCKADSWRAMAYVGGLAYYDYTVIWTGTEMIVWGGTGDPISAIYCPYEIKPIQIIREDPDRPGERDSKPYSVP